MYPALAQPPDLLPSDQAVHAFVYLCRVLQPWGWCNLDYELDILQLQPLKSTSRSRNP